MKAIHLRPASPDKDFAAIALLISSQEDDPTTETALREDYEQHQDSLVRIMTAEDQQGDLLGFYWAWRSKVEPGRVTFHLVVKPQCRGQGAGRQLYEHPAQTVTQAGVKKLRLSVRDDCPECRAFAERRGFSELRHHFGMELDLQTFDDRPYDQVIARLQGAGFQSTAMEALGDMQEARRKLYALNDAASASTPSQAGEHASSSFEDFQKSVCQSNWYKPAGQIVAIDTATSAWAAMSAITRKAPGTGVPGRDYAYNLFTGVDLPFRGRKLGQAVKLLALRYVRRNLQARIVRTHHNTRNLPMIAIDTKFGYRLLPGTFLMQKVLT